MIGIVKLSRMHLHLNFKLRGGVETRQEGEKEGGQKEGWVRELAAGARMWLKRSGGNDDNGAIKKK